MQIGRKRDKSIEQYRHNIKLLKYHLKKEQRINQTLKYKAVKNNNQKKNDANKKNAKPKQRIYSMLDTVSKLSQRMKVMGLSLADIFRMADAQYEGQISKAQFLKVVNSLKADIEDNLIQELFYAIDTDLNGTLDQNQYLEFLCAYGGADSKDAIKFQRKTLEKFAAQIKKKSIKPEGFLADTTDPISAYDFKKKLQPFTLNQNQKMILLKAFDPENSGNISHEFFIEQTKTIKEKTEQKMKNQELQKDIKHMCAKWRQSKINPIKVFEEADSDKKDGISPAELQEAFIKLMPDQTKFNIKKWVKMINFSNDNQITREEFTNSIRSFYALNQLEKFSADYQKQNPKARRGIKNEEMPTQKILKKLSEKIQVQKMTKKQAYKSMDINGDGTLTKEELAQGLKKLGFHIADVGRILSVFDRDVSEGVDETQWCKVLGQDVEFEEDPSDMDSVSDIDDKKKAGQKVLTNNTTGNKKIEPKPKSSIKQDKAKKPELKKNEQKPKKEEISNKPETAKKLDGNKRLDESKKKDSEKKAEETSKAKAAQKSKQVSLSKVKPNPKQVSEPKPASKKPEPKVPARQIKKKIESESEKEVEQQEDIDISEIQKQVGVKYKKRPQEVLSSFKKYDLKGKNVISLDNFKLVLEKFKVTFNHDQAFLILQDNSESGALSYKNWLDKIAAEYAQDIEEEKEKSPEKSPQKKTDYSKSRIKKTESRILSDKSIGLSKIKDDQKQIKKELKPSKIEEKLSQNNSVIPNESDLQSVRSIRSVRSNNPRQQIVAQKLSQCIQCPKEMYNLKKYMQRATKLKKQQILFEDQKFPANTQSITQNPQNSRLDNAQVKAKKLKWKHYSKLTTIENPQLFQDGIDPNDILQGGLGNCYFLSALACLAEYSNLIQRLFEHADIKTGYFLIWLCIDGAWKLYEIDGNIVVNPQGNQPYFTRSKQGELWVVLLEKAYAKAYGSFENIIGGDAGSAIRDLTGSPNKYFDHTKVKQQDLWKQLFDANQNKYIMSCGTDVSKQPQIKIEGRQQNVTAEGLVLGHAYSILDVREENKQKIIQLRNPWGSMEWNGDWSDKSPKWTKQLRQKLNFTGAQDGIFWMPFNEFFKRYRSTGINYLKSDYIYQSQTQKQTTNLLIKVSHSKLKEVFIGISQRDKRHMVAGNQPEYTPVSFLSLICEKGDQIRVIKNLGTKNWINTKQIQTEFLNLKQSQEAVLLVRMPKKTDLTVSAYANCRADFNVSSLQDDKVDTNYREAAAFIDDQKKSLFEGFDVWCSWVMPKVFYCVRNTQSKTKKIKLIFQKPDNIEFITPSKTKGEYLLTVEKGQTKSIQSRIIDQTKTGGFGPSSFEFP